MATTLHSYNTIIQYHNGTSLSTIGFVDSVNIATGSGVVETTNLASTGRTYMKGLTSAGDASFTVHYAGSNTALSAILAKVQVAAGAVPTGFKITYSDSSTMTFDAIVKDFSVKADLDSAVSADVSLQISGLITYSATA